MAKLGAILGSFEKEFGERSVRQGNEVDAVQRAPTGWFELDYALGGGLPRSRITEIFGVEGSGKTNLAYSVIRQNQILRPDEINVYVDLEHAYDPVWAKEMGVDIEKLVILEPDDAAQCADMVEAVLLADEVGVVVLDSIAALMTTKEIEESAEKALVGNTALMVGKMLRKLNKALATASKERDHDPVMILINQIRQKVGVMFGSPDTTPGGNAPKFFSSCRLSVYGKNVIDNKISDTRPVRKDTSVTVKKARFALVAEKAQFDLITFPAPGLRVGETDSWNTVEKMLRDRGDLVKGAKAKDGWLFFGKSFKTLKDCREVYRTNDKFRAQLQKVLIDGAELLIEEINPDTGEITEKPTPGVQLDFD